MTQIVVAIYEHGVFRPLEPVQLPENERVVLAVSDASDQNTVQGNATAPPASTDAMDRQRQALSQLRAQMAALPSEAPQDGLGGAKHDQILYGWQE
jgi:predicted DNA-binding antitoxin AbrB/MazE fold protein